MKKKPETKGLDMKAKSIRERIQNMFATPAIKKLSLHQRRVLQEIYIIAGDDVEDLLDMTTRRVSYDEYQVRTNS